MESQSLIFGCINGISKQNFDVLQPELQSYFEKSAWRDGALIIRSEREHAYMRKIFTLIASRISTGSYGSLLYVGSGNVVCFYFGHQKVTGRRYREPTPPEWWQND